MKRPPNILFLFTDQQRFDTLGALGNPLIKTPNLDRLVNEGTAFTHCYTPSPVCVSARAALATGLPPHLTGCYDNGNQVDPQVPSFMENLSSQGYQTHGVGKMHFTPDSYRPWGFQSRACAEEMSERPEDDFRKFVHQNGYDHVDDLNGARGEMYYMPQLSQLPARLHNTQWGADRSIDFLNNRDTSKPFFLWSSWIKPHPPFETPTPWNKLYRAPEMPHPHRPEGFEHFQAYWNKVQNRYKYYDQGYDALRIRCIKAAYYACISFIDYHVGRILDALGDEIDNTLILFSSDHGEMLGDHGCVGKRSMLDAAVRVPMVVRYPKRFAAGQQCKAPTTLLDVWPTFLAAAGHDQPQVCDEGVDLADVASGNTTRKAVFSQFQEKRYGLYMAATEQGKYIYSAADQQEWYFDSTQFGRETNSQIDSPIYAPQIQEHRQLLLDRFEQAGYEAPVKNGQWRSYCKAEIPSSPDAGLLFQDHTNLQDRIDSLGPQYTRPVAVSGTDGYKILQTPDNDMETS